MNELQQQHLEQRISEGYDFHPSLSLADGWRIFRKYTFGFISYAFLLPLASSLIGFIPGIGSWGMLISLVVLTPLLNAGYYPVSNRLIRGERVNYGHFFQWQGQAGAILLNSIIYYAIMALVLVPSFFALQQEGFFDWYAQAAAQPLGAAIDPPDLDQGTSTITLLNFLPLIYLLVSYIWAYPLLIFYQAGPWEALEYSRRLIGRRWGSFLFMLLTFFSLFLLFSMLLSVLAAVNIAIANFATLLLFAFVPFFHTTLFAAFARAIAPPQPAPEE